MSLNQKIPSITSLKQSAKRLASKDAISLHKAFNRIANQYGFTHWSLLLKHFNAKQIDSIKSIWQSLLPGEMLLLSAKKDSGKMSLALNIVALALNESIPVKYLSMYVDKVSVLSRLHLIANENKVKLWQDAKLLLVEDGPTNEANLLEKIQKCNPGSLIVIDYLQAIHTHTNHTQKYQDLFCAIKSQCHHNNLMILVLSQVTDDLPLESLDYLIGGRNICRHFSHVLHIESHAGENGAIQRELSLLKSTHYPKQKAILQFDPANFRFLCKT